MNITKLYENTWRIDDGGVRFFLLAGSERALMVDAGMTTKDAKSAAESLVDVPVELIITHADPDHIAGADAFDKFYMHPAEAYNYYKSQHRTGEFIPVWDGDALDLGGRSVEIIHLPGHTQGGIAVLDVGARALFSGDPVQRNGSIFMFGANRVCEQPRAPLRDARPLRPDISRARRLPRHARHNTRAARRRARRYVGEDKGRAR